VALDLDQQLVEGRPFLAVEEVSEGAYLLPLVIISSSRRAIRDNPRNELSQIPRPRFGPVVPRGNETDERIESSCLQHPPLARLQWPIISAEWDTWTVERARLVWDVSLGEAPRVVSTSSVVHREVVERAGALRIGMLDVESLGFTIHSRNSSRISTSVAKRPVVRVGHHGDNGASHAGEHSHGDIPHHPRDAPHRLLRPFEPCHGYRAERPER
jgi:hypothetical protein